MIDYYIAHRQPTSQDCVQAEGRSVHSAIGAESGSAGLWNLTGCPTADRQEIKTERGYEMAFCETEPLPKASVACVEIIGFRFSLTQLGNNESQILAETGHCRPSKEKTSPPDRQIQGVCKTLVRGFGMFGVRYGVEAKLTLGMRSRNYVHYRERGASSADHRFFDCRPVERGGSLRRGD